MTKRSLVLGWFSQACVGGRIPVRSIRTNWIMSWFCAWHEWWGSAGWWRWCRGRLDSVFPRISRVWVWKVNQEMSFTLLVRQSQRSFTKHTHNFACLFFITAAGYHIFRWLLAGIRNTHLQMIHCKHDCLVFSCMDQKEVWEEDDGCRDPLWRSCLKNVDWFHFFLQTTMVVRIFCILGILTSVLTLLAATDDDSR